MARNQESFAARTARRAQIEFGRLRRSLRSARVPKPIVAQPPPARDTAYNCFGSHQYGYWQPAIPGSYRWLKEISRK